MERDKELAKIRKHIAVLNDETGQLARSQGILAEDQKEITRHMSGIKVSVAELKTDMSWLKKSYWLVAGASVGALATGIISLL